MDAKKSPLKDKPLRQAGQSVQEELDNIVDDKLFLYLIAPLIAFLYALLEWERYLYPAEPNPLIATFMAVGITIYYAIKIFRLRREIQALKLGRDGEKAVGQYLEILREERCMVFHDIVGNNFNIDHIVVSEKGIYLIETKTYSKPDTEKPQVHYKNGVLTIDSLGDKSKILEQVAASSQWLRETLKESTGKDFQIRPVVLFPGWWIDTDDFKNIWILNPKGFPKFLENAKEQLTKEDKKLVAYHLSRYIRAL